MLVHSKIMVLVALSLCGFGQMGCSTKKKSDEPPVEKPTGPVLPQSSSTTVTRSGAQSSTLTEAVGKPRGWQYDRTGDKLSGFSRKASVRANERLQFGFPYEGGSTATLTLRTRDGSTSAYVEVSKGQFNRSFQGGNVQIRFDNAPSVTYSYSAAANGRANIIFLDDAPTLIRRLKRSKTTQMTIEFYGQGNRPLTFQTEGLRWSE